MDRENPEVILARIQEEQQKAVRGRLKIFFGYAAGVGKTYAMLEAARAARQAGVDVVCGYVEPHRRPETEALLDGLEQLPLQRGVYHGIELAELDIDQALQRHPQLILVDELAHTNAPFCRHKKRAQDVRELLLSGIDVYTTLNVQHIESLNDIVASLTGQVVRERIDDEVFDCADQVELVDIEPDDLLERLRAGKVYQEPSAALAGFFTREHLMALREVAVRRMADRMAHQHEAHQAGLDEHILICLSSSPSNPKVIRTAARMAAAFHGRFTALFVETPENAHMSPANRQRLAENTKLARSFGAQVITTYGSDVARQIAEYVRQAHISRVVLGRSMTKRRFWSAGSTFAGRLTDLAPELDIYIIPDKNAKEYTAERPHRWRFLPQNHIGRDTAILFGSLVVCTFLGAAFDALGLGEREIMMIYILGVLAPALFTESPLYSILASLLSIPAEAFFFAEPRYSFNIYAAGYPVAFAAMFIVSLTTGGLMSKVRGQAHQSAVRAYRTEVLLETSTVLQQVQDKAGIFRVTAGQLHKLLDRDIIFYDLADFRPQIFSRPGSRGSMAAYITDAEQALAVWVSRNNKHAGATTNTLPGSQCLYLAVHCGTRVLAVAAVVMKDEQLSSFESSMLVSIIDSCALALDRERQREKRHTVEAAARQEQLRANLLRAISHDIRTPLTTIAGNADLLQMQDAGLDGTKRRQLGQAIAEDARWLITMVENLLAVTRIENGTMQIHMEAEALSDIIQEAVRHAEPRAGQHVIRVELADELLLVRADARLLVQVFLNLLDNAVKYTPDGTEICISAQSSGGFAVVEVADQGTGIALEARTHLFDMFYADKKRGMDSRRGLGIGLSLCRAIVVAHGGSISVRDNHPHGTIFRFTLQQEETGRNE